jgi:hypothetical protein
MAIALTFATSSTAGTASGPKPAAVVYWSRVLLGIVSALITYLLQLKGTIPVLTVALGVYAASMVVFRLKYKDTKIAGGGPLFKGAGSFVMIWLFLLVFLYTLRPY